MGINIDVVISFTFGLGSALAAAGGVLYALNYPSIDPLMGVVPGLKAFVAAVLGGVGNIPGAALGALILGMVETFVDGSRWSTYKDAIAFADPDRDPAVPAGRAPRPVHRGEGLSRCRSRSSPWSPRCWRPSRVSHYSDRIDPYYLDVMTGVGINVILAVSLNLVNGYTGQFSLGHAGFMSVGAYLSAAITLLLGPEAARGRGRHGAPAGPALPRGAPGGRPRRRRGRARRRHPLAAPEGRLPGARHPRLRRDHPRRLPERRGPRGRPRAQRDPELHDGLLGVLASPR